MYKIALINMPFASAEIPSIALTQLQYVVRQELGEEVQCDIFYLNLDFVNYLGLQLFQMISASVEANTFGLGDWFFSGEAFPDQPDQTDLYLQRHFAEQFAELASVKQLLLNKRRAVGLFLKSLMDRYRLADYQLTGFTSMFSQNIACFAMAKRLKERRPDMVVLMGGANCETPMGNVIARQVETVDFVFSGPGLRSFPRFVRHLLAGEREECHRIPGVLSRQKLALAEGRLTEVGEELDIEVPLPVNYDGFLAAYDRKLHGQPFTLRIPFETSRGCWWGERSHCTFCGLNGATMAYRAMQPAAAIELFRDLFERYGSRVEEFEAVDNILPRRYLTDVLPQLEPPAQTRIFYEVKADLKEHEMEVLERAHVTRIQPGIEALSTSTLKLMKKGTTAFQNLRFLMYCQRSNVEPYWNLLVGFPNEPESVYEKYARDIPLLTHLHPPSGVFPVRFDRFSPYHKLASEYGLKLLPGDFYGMLYPFPAEELTDLAYFFRNDDFHAAYLVSTAKWLRPLRELVGRWQAMWRSDQKPDLVLREAAGGSSVLDSRSGKLVEHVLSAQGLRVLDVLTTQHKIPRLVEALADIPGEEVAREVEALQGLGLLFEEDGTYMSVVKRLRREATEEWTLQPGMAETRAASGAAAAS
jgi:ribosomal peptide maturation radical SAM protein 1